MNVKKAWGSLLTLRSTIDPPLHIHTKPTPPHTHNQQVVFRSCKLIPTMAISGFMNSKRFTCVEYGAAVAVCLGLVLFGLADFSVSPTFRYGFVLVGVTLFMIVLVPPPPIQPCTIRQRNPPMPTSQKHNSPLGMLLLFLSIVCDSILPNVQEKLFAAGSSRLVRALAPPFFPSFWIRQTHGYGFRSAHPTN